jgi:hypothetical protein
MGSVLDMDISGFNVLRLLGIKNHRIQICNTIQITLAHSAANKQR